MWALSDMAELVTEAKGLRGDGLQAFAVLNGADPGAWTDSADAITAFADFPDLTLIDAPIRRRKAFANAMSAGLSVNELAPRDPKASQELDTLVSTIKTAGKQLV